MVISAFSPTNPVYKIILDGIRQPLQEEFGNTYNMHTEYLETDRFPEEEIVQKHVNLCNEKYRKIKLDLIICVGVDAVNPIKKYGDNFLLDLPAINYDLDFSDFGVQMEKFLNEQTTYVGLKLNPTITISTALKNFPKTDTIYFISGFAKVDEIYREITRQSLKNNFPQLEVVFLIDMSMDEVLLKVSQLSGNDLIAIASYNRDNRGVPFSSNDVIRLISKESKVPVISYSDLGFGEGALGGRILSFHKAGLFTGKSAVKILYGANPNSIQISEDDYYAYQYDWRELERWNINEKKLKPKGYTLHYKELNFFARYKWIIIATLMFLLLQTVLIINLVISHRKQKILIRQIREAENKFREFAHEDRILRVGQMTASLSHELIQPLTAILSTAQAGVRFIDSDNFSPQLLKDILGNIIEDNKRTTSILRTIQGMMKLENRKKEKTDLNSLINEVLTIYRNEAIGQNIKIILQLAEKPVFIIADKVQIQQVILNFLINAGQVLGTNDIGDKKITITQSQDGEDVTIAVSDNGEGISKEIFEKLFKPFVTSKATGLGIGLSICRTIIEEHSGRIWAENIPERGAKFSFSLKICKDGNKGL